jgi:Ca2+-binding RTX toxin-like protein
MVSINLLLVFTSIILSLFTSAIMVGQSLISQTAKAQSLLSLHNGENFFNTLQNSINSNNVGTVVSPPSKPLVVITKTHSNTDHGHSKESNLSDTQIERGLDVPKNLIAPTPPCATTSNSNSATRTASIIGPSTASSSNLATGPSAASIIGPSAASIIGPSAASSSNLAIGPGAHVNIDNGTITTTNNSSMRRSIIMNSSLSSGCPIIIGTNGPDIIIASAISNPAIFGLRGNDVLECGPGNCKVFGGPGDNVMESASSTTAQLYGGSGDNTFIGGAGDTLMVGGKGNDQFYAGTGHDVMIGGGGTNYFDCGPNGNGVILDFNAKRGDTKASDCKFVITVNTPVTSLP